MADLPIIEATSSEKPLPETVRSLAAISRLLSYPDNHYLQLVELLYLLVQDELPDAAKEVSEFGQFVEQCGEFELEEAYTRTFDVNPSCALEIGWHLFGEDYMRGQFLVRMRGELAKHEIPESSELPDHLAHVLAVIGAMSDDEAKPFVHACVFPALFKMQQALDENGSPYRHLMHCLVQVLQQYYGAGESWSEEDGVIPHDADAFPGQNGPRPRGLADPLRSYPMPENSCGVGGQGDVQLVPLQMRYSPPGTNGDGHEDKTNRFVNGSET